MITGRGSLKQTWGSTQKIEQWRVRNYPENRLDFFILRVVTPLGNYTPWKINMEPTNHPFRKENYLPNLHESVPCSSSRV